jgi:hypothetical protein
MKPFRTAARTLGICASIAIAALLFDTGRAAADGGRDWGHGGGLPVGLVQGSGTGTVTAEVQPGTSTACTATSQCAITVSGTGAAQPFFGLGEFDLSADLTADLPGGTPNGFGGECYPVTGSLTLSPIYGKWNPGTLVVDLQGQDCAVGSSTTSLVIAATYVVDGTNSTGRFAGASGTGTVSAAIDDSQSPPAVEFAFSGSLQGPSNRGDGDAKKSAH